MAYTNAQMRQHIYELQTYLYAISMIDKNIPQVIPSGVYGQDTTAAVKAFQHEYGLNATGNTDPATWNKIVHVYRNEVNSAPVPYNAFPSATAVIHKGDSGQIVYILQAMLDNIGRSFDNSPNVEVCGKYNSSTADAIKLFQKRVGLAQTGTVNSATWNMLVHCCEHINNSL